MKLWFKIQMKSMPKLLLSKKKNTSPVKRLKPINWCCTWWKTLKILSQVKIKWDNMWGDGNYTWTSSLKVLSRGSLSDWLWQTECSIAPWTGVLVINNGIGFQSKCFEWTFGRQLDTIKLIAVDSTLRKCQLRNSSFMFILQKNSRNYETCPPMRPGNRVKFTGPFSPQLGL